jgi:hypothetical protein
MHELTLLAAFLAGVLGSTHCAAMCGGIATALGAAPGGARRHRQLLLYHLGRIASYATAGAIAAALGAAAGSAFAISRWSEILRLATAAVVVVIGLDIALSGTSGARWLRLPEQWGARLWRRVAPLSRASLPAAPAARALVLGLLWGWLPCGLVYSVLLAAALAGGVARGAAVMIVFGLGTLPAMAGLSYLGARLPRPGGSLARLLGAALVACGLWTAAVPIAALSGAHQHHHAVASAAAEGPGRLR